MKRLFRRFRVWVISGVVGIAGGGLGLGLAGTIQVVHAEAKPNFKIAMILDKGGKDDRSFNSSAVEGLKRVEKELHATVKYVEPADDNAFESMIRSFAQRHFDVIYMIGASQSDTLKKMAALYKEQHFVLVDAEVISPNVQSLIFDEHEGSYLVGALAALSSKTGKIGFIGGMDVPIIRRFEWGYTSGAKHAKPNIKVISNFIGVTPDSWNNPAKGKELATSQYNLGADVIFGAAGGSGAGLFDAAEEKKKFAIGVDSNQNWVKPGFVLTSMVKKIDEAIFQSAQQAIQGKFVAGTQRFGLANHGVGYSLDQYNEKLIPPAVRAEVEKMKADIISGKIRVPDYYKSRK